MNQKKKNHQFRKSINNLKMNDDSNPQKNKVGGNTTFVKSRNNQISIQRQKAKSELINKYSMSESEAEEVLQRIEKDIFEKKQTIHRNINLNSKTNNSTSISNTNFADNRDKEKFLNKKREELNKSEIIKQKSSNQDFNESESDEKRLKKFLIDDDNEDVIIPVHSNNSLSNEANNSEEAGVYGENYTSLSYYDSLDENVFFSKENKDYPMKNNSNVSPDIFSDFNIGDEDKLISSLNIFSSTYNSSVKNRSSSFDINNYIKNRYQEDMIKDPIFSEKDNFNYDSNEVIAEMNSQSIHDVDGIISELSPGFKKTVCIELENVSLSFEKGNDKIDNLKEYFIRTLKHNKEKKNRFQALKDINFKIFKGEKVAIIGYNGAGKSTLLSVITGIYPPETGTVKTYGRISPLLSLGAGFDRNYSGRENIFLNGAILGYDKEFLLSKFDEILEFSELDEFIDFPVKNYSSGMLAKLGFSIATIVEPDILIIDEVLGVGDVSFQRKCGDKIRSLMDSGTTVLLVSHSIPQIRNLCEKAIWIDHGVVREIGEVNAVCDHYLEDSKKASREQLKNIKFS